MWRASRKQTTEALAVRLAKFAQEDLQIDLDADESQTLLAAANDDAFRDKILAILRHLYLGARHNRRRFALPVVPEGQGSGDIHISRERSAEEYRRQQSAGAFQGSHLPGEQLFPPAAALFASLDRAVALGAFPLPRRYRRRRTSLSIGRRRTTIFRRARAPCRMILR